MYRRLNTQSRAIVVGALKLFGFIVAAVVVVAGITFLSFTAQRLWEHNLLQSQPARAHITRESAPATSPSLAVSSSPVPTPVAPVAATRPEVKPSTVDTTPNGRPVQTRQWQLTWFNSKNLELKPEQQRGIASARLTTLKPTCMEFTTEYEESGLVHHAYFVWDKTFNAEHGAWRRDNTDVLGEWHLDQVSPTLYTGWMTKLGERIEMRLQVAD
jgi:hypothetical protein